MKEIGPSLRNLRKVENGSSRQERQKGKTIERQSYTTFAAVSSPPTVYTFSFQNHPFSLDRLPQTSYNLVEVTPDSKESEHMQSMTEEEARRIMKANGWNYKERSPKRHAKYVYARRGQDYKMIERYICPLLKLSELTEKELVEILARPIKKSSSAKSGPEVDPLNHMND